VAKRGLTGLERGVREVGYGIAYIVPGAGAPWLMGHPHCPPLYRAH